MNNKLKTVIFSLVAIGAIILALLFVSGIGYLTPETSALGCPGYPQCRPFEYMEVFDCTELICGYGTWGVCLRCVRDT